MRICDVHVHLGKSEPWQPYGDPTIHLDQLILLLAHPSEGCVGAMRDSDNIYVETSGTMPGFIEMATRIDENRVLFGSGIPYFRVPTQVAIIEAAEIPDKAKRRVYSGNFERLFRQ